MRQSDGAGSYFGQRAHGLGGPFAVPRHALRRAKRVWRAWHLANQILPHRRRSNPLSALASRHASFQLLERIEC